MSWEVARCEAKAVESLGKQSEDESFLVPFSEGLHVAVRMAWTAGVESERVASVSDLAAASPGEGSATGVGRIDTVQKVVG